LSALFRLWAGIFRVDQLDRRILDIVQDNADLTSEALSELVNLSPSAVQRRLARLKKDGVISRTVAMVDPKAVGRTLTILVEIEIQTEHRQGLDQFQRWLQAADEVQSGWYVTGSTDYVLLVTVRDLEEYNQFIEVLMSENPIVRRYTSLVVLRTVKSGFKIKIG
jgi:Lrp/AsnC family transcriptional regulator, leucine-responsive regulatory protein